MQRDLQLLSLQLVPSGECLLPLHKSLPLGLEQFTHSTIVAPSPNCSFVCFSSVQRVWKNGMAVLQLSRRGFLLHEIVSTCCTLCDNMGRESIGNRIEGPRINKVLSLSSQGYSGLNCIVSQPIHTGKVQAEEEGLQKASFPSSSGNLHFSAWRTSAALGRVLWIS